MKRPTQILVIVLAIGFGYGAHYTTQLMGELDRPVVVPQSRMSELTSSLCANAIEDKSVELSLVKTIFDNPATPFSDLDIKMRSGNGGCTFEYMMAGDSYIQGWGVVQVEGSRITGIKFYNQLDTRLMNSNDPSFSVFFFLDQGENYIFETLRNRLYAGNGGHPRVLGSGARNRRPTR